MFKKLFLYSKHLYKNVPDVYEKCILCVKTYLLPLKNFTIYLKNVDHLFKSVQNLYLRRKMHIVHLRKTKKIEETNKENKENLSWFRIFEKPKRIVIGRRLFPTNTMLIALTFFGREGAWALLLEKYDLGIISWKNLLSLESWERRKYQLLAQCVGWGLFP